MEKNHKRGREMDIGRDINGGKVRERVWEIPKEGRERRGILIGLNFGGDKEVRGERERSKGEFVNAEG